jgi:hypothetical protein
VPRWFSGPERTAAVLTSCGLPPPGTPPAAAGSAGGSRVRRRQPGPPAAGHTRSLARTAVPQTTASGLNLSARATVGTLE